MRSIWRGALSFGLIHIPVRLYSASRDRELKFKLLHHKDLSEIRYARICKAEGKEVPWEEVVKGYQVEKGDYIVLTEEDFKRANLKKTQMIEIIDFTKEEDIDSIYYSTPYYLEPEKGAEKPYVLLCAALNRSKKVAIGHFVLRHHERLGVIRPHENILMLHQLRYEAEIISAKGLTIPKVSVPKDEITMALKLIDELTAPFNPSKYTDTYTDEVKAMIAKKAQGKRIPVPKEPPVHSAKVQDILSLLKSSLKEGKKKRTKSRRRRIA